MGSEVTRRQFLLGTLLFAVLDRDSIEEPLPAGRDMELCLMRCSGLLTYSEAWKRDISGGKSGWGIDNATYAEKKEAESDYLEGLSEGDVLSIGRVGCDEDFASGIGDFGWTSLSRIHFSLEGQSDLLESVMVEASYGTDMYATVLKVLTFPGIEWIRNVWLSIHAMATPDNEDRLRRIASCRFAVKCRAKYESDVKAYRSINNYFR